MKELRGHRKIRPGSPSKITSSGSIYIVERNIVERNIVERNIVERKRNYDNDHDTPKKRYSKKVRKYPKVREITITRS